MIARQRDNSARRGNERIEASNAVNRFASLGTISQSADQDTRER